MSRLSNFPVGFYKPGHLGKINWAVWSKRPGTFLKNRPLVVKLTSSSPQSNHNSSRHQVVRWLCGGDPMFQSPPCNRLKSWASSLDILIFRSTAGRVRTMAYLRLAAPAAFFATLTILSIFSIASVEMRDPLAVTISRMKKMQQEKDREGVADIAPQWIPQRPAGNYVP